MIKEAFNLEDNLCLLEVIGLFWNRHLPFSVEGYP
jgi:hypothetical protein